MSLSNSSIVGVVGAGTMGRGIAQIAATNGHTVHIFDTNEPALEASRTSLAETLEKLASKGKISADDAKNILGRISFDKKIASLSKCDFIIEAAVEDLQIKKELFNSLEQVVSRTCILASNTSSLSIASLSSLCTHKERIIGVHFFNPAPLMALVEVVPSLLTDREVLNSVSNLVTSWGKKVVIAKDTPGFIVNRIARPFYGEALRILEEGIATHEEIDSVMKDLGGFKMGPFELMDLIGNDINFKVTESVFEAFFYDSRYRPSLIQKRMVEAGYFGRKTKKGYYSYGSEEISVKVEVSPLKSELIFKRIISMLINEAVDALYLNIATREDIDTAMTLGVNYPKGLLDWCDEIGAAKVLSIIDELYEEYREDRYRASALLRRKAKDQSRID